MALFVLPRRPPPPPAHRSQPNVTYFRYSLLPRAIPTDGRARLLLALAPPAAPAAPAASARPLRLSVHLYVAAPARALVRALGAHSASDAWLPSAAADPWHRNGAFFGWDGATSSRVTEERRVYMSGLSDGAGAGASVAVSVKQLGLPEAAEVARIEEYVHETLYQGDRPERKHYLQGTDDTVRLSMLYWSDEMNDATSAVGRAATAAAPGLSRVCRGCWPSRCSWMDCWSEAHSLESWF